MNSKEKYISFDLRSIVERIFVDNQREIIELLGKYKLNSIIENTVEIIKKHQLTAKGDFSNEWNIGNLASSYLTGINSKLSTIENEGEKRNLEYIMSEISRELIFVGLKSGKTPLDVSVKNLITSLQTTCLVNNYNFNELKEYLHLDTILHMVDVTDHQPVIHLPLEKPIYYEWLRQSYELDELSKNLKSEECISSVKEFKKLFKPNSGSIKVQVNRDCLDFMIILFDVLKREGMVKPKGTIGHFSPLVKYGVDFQNKVLITKEPKHIKYTIKKNKEKARKLYGKVEKWLVQ